MMLRRMMVFVLVLSAGGLYVAMQQVDAALGRMSAIGGEQGTGLAFPIDGARAQRFVESWDRYLGRFDPTTVTSLVNPPATLHTVLALLDLLFVVAYALLLLLWRRWAESQLDRVAAETDELAEARAGLVRWVRWGIVGLVAVDLVEDLLLVLTYGLKVPVTVLDGPISLLKYVLLGLVVVPLAFVTLAIVRERKDLRAAAAGSRAVLIPVGLLVLLLLLTSIGAQQVDDVIRAWSIGQAAFAVAATLLAAWVATSGVVELTNRSRENLRPREGKDPQWLVLGGAVVLAAAAAVLALTIGAWGLFVPAILLALIWLGGWLVTPHAVSGAVRRLLGLPPRDHVAPVRAAARASTPTGRPTSEELAAAGLTIARIAGAAVCLVTCWIVVRASAYDLWVRTDRPVGSLLLSVGAVTVVAVAGAVGVAVVGRRPADPGRSPRPLILTTALTFVVLWATLVDTDATAIALPTVLGSVAVMMIGVAASAGVFSVAAALIRRGNVRSYRLPLLLRLAGRRRFPVVIFFLVWVLVLSLLDRGGFHDARRIGLAQPGDAPSLQEAFGSWRGTHSGAGAHPLVLVAAQGGGIRAAVWTAMVMDCVFGPGPAPVEGSENVCADGSGDTAATRPLPVFLASGTSGGAVGLAGWSARRIDLAEGVAGVPRIDDILPADYVAPDVARLLSGDLLYQLLAHHFPDRAAVLERSLEQAWGASSGAGLSRGLRASYALANSGGQWGIPVLAFNGSAVEDGCRFVTSPVDMVVPRSLRDPGTRQMNTVTGTGDRPDDATCGTGRFATDPAFVDALPRTNELIDYLCPDEDVRLSTAGLLSSRFPYVSPTARIASGKCNNGENGRMDRDVVSYITDGGVADNSGASTAAEAWAAVQPMAATTEEARRGDCVVPLFLQIDNGVDSSGDAATRPPNELTAPVGAVVTRFGGQESLSRSEARTDFATLRTASGYRVEAATSDTAWFRIAPAIQPGMDPPLGWTLSAETIRGMHNQLVSAENAAKISRLRALLTGDLTCPAPEVRAR